MDQDQDFLNNMESQWDETKPIVGGPYEPDNPLIWTGGAIPGAEGNPQNDAADALLGQEDFRQRIAKPAFNRLHNAYRQQGGYFSKYYSRLKELTTAFQAAGVPVDNIPTILRTMMGLGGADLRIIADNPAVATRSIFDEDGIRALQPQDFKQKIDNMIKYSSPQTGRRINMMLQDGPNTLKRFNQYDPKSQLFETTSIKKNFIQSFPQWMAGQIKKQGNVQQKFNTDQKLTSEAKDQNSRLWTSLAQMAPNSFRWSQTDGRWIGRGAETFIKKNDRKIVAYKEKTAKSMGLLKTTLTPTQAQQQIPGFVKQVISANSTLSKVGFGPISTNSSSLYAGRWIDRTSGRVRVLPSAQSKFINPAIKQQKLGYLQAKLINHWNNCVSTYDEYEKLLRSGVNLAQKTAKSIANGLNSKETSLKFYNFIINKVVAYMRNPTLPTAQMGLIRGAGGPLFQDLLTQLPRALQPVKDDIANQDNTQLQMRAGKAIQIWKRMMQAGKNFSLNRVQGDVGLDAYQKNRLTYKIWGAYSSMVGYAGRTVGNALKKMNRMTIPANVSANKILQLTEDVTQRNQRINQVILTNPQQIPDVLVNQMAANAGGFLENIKGGKRANPSSMLDNYVDQLEKIPNKRNIADKLNRSNLNQIGRNFFRGIVP